MGALELTYCDDARILDCDDRALAASLLCCGEGANSHAHAEAAGAGLGSDPRAGGEEGDKDVDAEVSVSSSPCLSFGRLVLPLHPPVRGGHRSHNEVDSRWRIRRWTPLGARGSRVGLRSSGHSSAVARLIPMVRATAWGGVGLDWIRGLRASSLGLH